MNCELWIVSCELWIEAKEVEHLEYLVLRGLLVDADVADVGEQGEVDDACLVLLVVLHELEQAVVLLADVKTHDLTSHYV